MKSQGFWLGLLCSSLVLVGCGAETAASPANESVDSSVELVVSEPTVSPTLPPTVTAVLPTNTPPLPTETPLPTATATGTPEPAKITNVADLVGYWTYNGVHSTGGGQLHYVYRFRADGVLETADFLDAFAAGEVKARTDFWFEDGVWYTQIVTGFWRNNTCFLGSGKPVTGRYEIRPDVAGILRFYRIVDNCQVRNFGLSDNDGRLTPLIVQNVDWFTDSETGWPLNPSEFPLNGRFVLVGTLLELDATDDTAPQATLRLPSGASVTLTVLPLDSPLISGEAAVDLAAYDPDFPVRARLLVQANGRQPLQVQEMVILTTLE